MIVPRKAAAAVLVAAGVAFGPWAGTRGDDSSPGVRFVVPRRVATVIGPTLAELDVVPPAGATIVKVSLLVDGKPAGTKTAPPWSFRWDAGDGSVGHALEARAAFSDGTEASATLATSRLVINASAEVALVNVYAIARDGRKGYVTDLTKDEFRVFENDRPQVIDRFSPERKPLRIAIVLDTSLSMGDGGKLDAAIDAAIEFLDLLEPGDEGLVIGFSDSVTVLQDLTSNRSELSAAIRKVTASGGTALYDAIFRASERLAQFDGRRVLLLLSDGRDEAANGLEPGSLHTLDEARDRTLHNDVMVFAIGLGRPLAKDAKTLRDNSTAAASEVDFYGRQPLVTILSSLAETTGGAVVFSPGAGQLRRSFAAIATDLRHQYSLAYRSDDSRHDGTWRAIRVVVDRPGITVTNRLGYYAPSDLPGRRRPSSAPPPSSRRMRTRLRP
jgi:Ca-activated chloride channel homolog